MTSLAALTVLLASGTLVPVCIYLVFHRDYGDGFFGRACLALICLAAFARFGSFFHLGLQFITTPVSVALWVGLSGFLVRHAWRFHRRLRLREGRTWYDER